MASKKGAAVRWVHLDTDGLLFTEPHKDNAHLFRKEVKHRGRWVDPAEKLLWILNQPEWAGGVFTTHGGEALVLQRFCSAYS